MKKIFYFLITAFCALKLSAQTDTLVINGFTFLAVKKHVAGESDGGDTIVRFYRIENGQRKYLLKHFIYMASGDCNNTYEDFGSYEICHDSIIFKTTFSQSGSDPIPDERKQIYIVNSDGKLLPVYDKELYRWNDSWVNSDFFDDQE